MGEKSTLTERWDNCFLDTNCWQIQGVVKEERTQKSSNGHYNYPRYQVMGSTQTILFLKFSKRLCDTINALLENDPMGKIWEWRKGINKPEIKHSTVVHTIPITMPWSFLSPTFPGCMKMSIKRHMTSLERATLWKAVNFMSFNKTHGPKSDRGGCPEALGISNEHNVCNKVPAFLENDDVCEHKKKKNPTEM